MSPTSFAVADVSPPLAPCPELPYPAALQRLLSVAPADLESCSRYHGTLVDTAPSHPLIAALHLAFAEHRPLVLTPDVIWLTLTHGLARHVERYADELRHQLVPHDGKETVVVIRDDFVRGTPENPWTEVFDTFSRHLMSVLGRETHELIVADFSTTGLCERAASEVTLMDVAQSYFHFEVHTRCGVPAFRLEGTEDDWIALAARVAKWRAFDLDEWLDPLTPVLDHFVRAARGQVDREWWDSIYKWKRARGSGAAFVNGWISRLFPYLVDREARRKTHRGGLRPNPWLSDTRVDGPGRDDFPAQPASTPFVWEYYGRRFPMRFVGGLVGVAQTDGWLKPEIGWAVVRESEAVPLPADGASVLE